MVNKKEDSNTSIKSCMSAQQVLPTIGTNCSFGVALKHLTDFAYTNIKVKEAKSKDITKRLVEAKEIIQSFDPKNNQELMLATQMATVHETQQRLSMYMFNGNLDPMDMMSFTNMITKLSNTFIQQITAMQKLKGNNQQKVTIEHVHVHNGGQAVVGAVHTSVEEEKK